MEKVISVMRRYELKYILSKEQVDYFTKRIAQYMKVDKYGLTSIASLYYDTKDFTLINRSIEKPKYKEKIRLRSYGLAKEDTTCYLELKRKYDGIVYKRRIGVKEKAVEEFLKKGNELENSQIGKELIAFNEHYGKLEPKYLIIYDRVAYYQENGDVRITIDHNPRYRVDDLNLNTSMEGKPLLKEGEAILEIKVQHSLPLWLVGVLTEGGIYQNSFSKVGTAHKITMSYVRNKVTIHNELIKKGNLNNELTLQ